MCVAQQRGRQSARQAARRHLALIVSGFLAEVILHELPHFLLEVALKQDDAANDFIFRKLSRVGQ